MNTHKRKPFLFRLIYSLRWSILAGALSTSLVMVASPSAEASSVGDELTSLVKKYQGLQSKRTSNTAIPGELVEVTTFADSTFRALIGEAEKKYPAPGGIQYGWIVFGSWARQELSVVSDLDLLLVAVNVKDSAKKNDVKTWGESVKKEVADQWEQARKQTAVALKMSHQDNGAGTGLQLDWVEGGLQIFASTQKLIAFMGPHKKMISDMWTDARMLKGSVDYDAIRQPFEIEYDTLFTQFSSQWTPSLTSAKSKPNNVSAKQLFTRGMTLSVGGLYRQWRRTSQKTNALYEYSTLERLLDLKEDKILDDATVNKATAVFLRSLKWEVDSGVSTWTHGAPLKSSRVKSWVPWKTVANKFALMCDDALSVNQALAKAYAKL